MVPDLIPQYAREREDREERGPQGRGKRTGQAERVWPDPVRYYCSVVRTNDWWHKRRGKATQKKKKKKATFTLVAKSLVRLVPSQSARCLGCLGTWVR